MVQEACLVLKVSENIEVQQMILLPLPSHHASSG